MEKKYLLINLDEVELTKKVDFNVFIREYIICRNSNLCKACSKAHNKPTAKKCKRSKHTCTTTGEKCSENRDYTINMILNNNKINLSEKELNVLKEMVESRWECLKKIDNLESE